MGGYYAPPVEFSLLSAGGAFFSLSKVDGTSASGGRVALTGRLFNAVNSSRLRVPD